jgi:DNA mismatch repair protein MutL
MRDTIRVLPDSIANQIAAGEVVQRPASVVKELMENSVDAGSSIITLVLKDSGKSLIQVVDNGRGMSSADSRLCFERHATSKLSEAADLFKIVTKGFRGEALASIAAVSQVELRTRPQGEELGARIIVEDSEVKVQEVFQCPAGSSFSVKNLFYNTPARRQFLKSDQVEYRHIVDEFQRIALAHSGIAFKLLSEGSEVYNLPAGTLRQRISAIFGSRHDERLVPVEVETDIVKISGFVGKPEFSRKTRGEQFFFANGRFIRSAYFNHAVNHAYERLLPEGNFPFYALFIEVDPGAIDVNIHPTKTEVKFRDEKPIYTFIISAIRQGMGKYSVVPSIDFELETSFQLQPLPREADIKIPTIQVNPNYNPFDERKIDGFPGRFGDRVKNSDWRGVFGDFSKHIEPAVAAENILLHNDDKGLEPSFKSEESLFLLGKKFIISTLGGKLLAVYWKRAMERIYYERYMDLIGRQAGSSQQLLFPETISLHEADAQLVLPLLEELHAMGLEVEPLGRRDFVIRGVPSDATGENATSLLEQFIEEYRNGEGFFRSKPQERLAYSLTKGMVSGMVLKSDKTTLSDVLGRLFACSVPYHDPLGRNTMITFTADDLESKFS